MTDREWFAFVLGCIVFQLLKMVYLIADQAARTHREKKVVKVVRVAFPNNSKITYITVDSSDKRAMKKMINQVRTQFAVQEGEIEGIFSEDPSGYTARLSAASPIKKSTNKETDPT